MVDVPLLIAKAFLLRFFAQLNLISLLVHRARTTVFVLFCLRIGTSDRSTEPICRANERTTQRMVERSSERVSNRSICCNCSYLIHWCKVCHSIFFNFHFNFIHTRPILRYAIRYGQNKHKHTREFQEWKNVNKRAKEKDESTEFVSLKFCMPHINIVILRKKKRFFFAAREKTKRICNENPLYKQISVELNKILLLFKFQMCVCFVVPFLFYN